MFKDPYDMQDLCYRINALKDSKQDLNEENWVLHVKRLKHKKQNQTFSEIDLWSHFHLGYWTGRCGYSTPSPDIFNRNAISVWLGYQYAKCTGDIDKIKLRLDGFC